MRPLQGIAVLFLLLWLAPAHAQEIVHFPSLNDNGLDQPPTMIEAHLFRPAGEGRHPAVVGLHGCSGMYSRSTGLLSPLYRAWGTQLAAQGYVALLVDSLGPRQHGETCSIQGFDLAFYRKRPMDAYGGLWFLQKQSFVQGDRIGLIGWSQGGGVTLNIVAPQRQGRPSQLPQGDFRAAVAFYPGSCNIQRHPPHWTSALPLLVLTGAEDVWTPAAPCKEFIDAAIAAGSRIEMLIYPGAFHGFDAPNQPRLELPNYVTRAGVVPIVGTDPIARADALARVPAFLARYVKN